MQVKLPKALLKGAGLKAGAVAQLEVPSTAGTTVSAKSRRSDIDDSIARITPEELCLETDWGPPVGKEVW